MGEIMCMYMRKNRNPETYSVLWFLLGCLAAGTAAGAIFANLTWPEETDSFRTICTLSVWQETAVFSGDCCERAYRNGTADDGFDIFCIGAVFGSSRKYGIAAARSERLRHFHSSQSAPWYRIFPGITSNDGFRL